LKQRRSWGICWGLGGVQVCGVDMSEPRRQSSEKSVCRFQTFHHLHNHTHPVVMFCSLQNTFSDIFLTESLERGDKEHGFMQPPLLPPGWVWCARHSGHCALLITGPILGHLTVESCFFHVCLLALGLERPNQSLHQLQKGEDSGCLEGWLWRWSQLLVWGWPRQDLTWWWSLALMVGVRLGTVWSSLETSECIIWM
jgi:hypothetical protein